MSNLQIYQFKSSIKYCTEVTLKISSNIAGDSNNENNFPHKLLLTNAQVSNLHKAFANGSWGNVKLSKTQLDKTRQSGGLPLIGNVLKPLVKSVLIPLGLTLAVSWTDKTICKKMFRSVVTTLIISNEGINDIMKIVKSLEKSGLLIKGVSETIKNEAKGQKGVFLCMLLGALGTSLLGNLWTGNGTITAQSQQNKISSSFNKFWDTNVLSQRNISRSNLIINTFIQEIIHLK